MEQFLCFLAATPVLAGAITKNKFRVTFSTLSFLFILLFYCAPLWLALDGGFVYLGNRISLSGSSTLHLILGLFLFSVGFAFCEFLVHSKIKTDRHHQDVHKTAFRMPRLLELTLITMLCATALFAYISEIYTAFIAMRRGEEDSSYIASITFMAVYFLSSFLLLAYLSERKYVKSAIVLPILSFVALSFAGRMKILLVLAIPFFHFGKGRLIPLVAALAVAALSMPLILNGKALIYELFLGHSVADTVMDAYVDGINISSLVTNIGHPMVSYLYAPDLVNRIGYRWFWDVPHGVLFYLRLIGVDLGDSLTYFNTEMLLSRRESIVPPGYLGFGYVQAGLVGVFISGLLFRVVGHVAEIVRNSVVLKSDAATFYFAFLAANTFYIGEPRALVLTFAFPLLVIYIVSRPAVLSSGSRRENRYVAPSR